MNQRRWGIILSYGEIILTFIKGLVYTPIMLRLLGQAEYGLYSLIGAVVGYLSIFDMGLGNTLVRYIAINRASGTVEREGELNGLFVFIYGVIGIITLIIGGILYINIDDIFGDSLSDLEMQRAHVMMLLLIFNLALTFQFSVFASIIQAYERYIYLRILDIARSMLTPVLILPFLYLGYGSVMMVVVSTLLNITGLLANCYYCFHYLHIKFKRWHFQKKFLREVAVYSFFIFLNAIVDKVYWWMGQFILGVTSGTVQVAVYAISMHFMRMYMNLSSAISGVLLPKITMMVASGADYSLLTKLMIRIGRIQYFIVGYIFLMFLIMGKEFIILWAGEDYIAAYPIVLLLMGAMLIPLIQNVGISILKAMNLNGYRVATYTLCALVAFGISFPLCKAYGGLGCAIATSSSLIISTGLIMNQYYANKLHLGIREFWCNILSISKGFVVVVLFSEIIRNCFRLNISWCNFLVLVLVYTVIYVFVIYSWCMNEEERGLCRRFVMRLKGFIK